ncbi:MAG TPA: Clp protease N-terminal domain-containing protein [Gemmatales bacterium]|nr:Clp protease N-terminal domain-containing protein [Gemmatales bacterium]HMP59117.1 Clp protease N-terminal domain-containing protein [Gemmatales bacterium]
MPESYSRRANAVLLQVRHIALQLHVDFVDSSHMLYALLQSRCVAIRRILTALQASPDDLRRAAEKRLVAGPESIRAGMGWAVKAMQALYEAEAEAEAARRRLITTRDLFLGLLSGTRGGAAEALKEVGVTLEAVRRVLGLSSPS